MCSENLYPAPISLWHSETIKKLKEFEQLCRVKPVIWTYFGSRSSGIVHKCSSWSMDYLYITDRQEESVNKSVFLIGRHIGNFGIDLKGANQDNNCTYQGFRGRNLKYCLESLNEYGTMFNQLGSKEQFELAEKNEQTLFFAMAPFLYINSPFVYGNPVLKEKLLSEQMGRHLKISLSLFSYLVKKNFKLIYGKKIVKVHDYLYVFRAIYQALWVLEKKEFPPTDIKNLLSYRKENICIEILDILKVYNNQTDKELLMLEDERLNTEIKDKLSFIESGMKEFQNDKVISLSEVESILDYLKETGIDDETLNLRIK